MRKSFLITSSFIFLFTVVSATSFIYRLQAQKSSSVSFSFKPFVLAQDNFESLLSAKLVQASQAKISKRKAKKVHFNSRKRPLKVTQKAFVSVEKSKKKYLSETIRFHGVKKIANVEKSNLKVIEYSNVSDYSKNNYKFVDNGEISVDEKITVKPIKVEVVKKTNLLALFKPIEEEVVNVKTILAAKNKEIKKYKENKDKNSEDRISTAMAANETSTQEAPVVVSKNAILKNAVSEKVKVSEVIKNDLPSQPAYESTGTAKKNTHSSPQVIIHPEGQKVLSIQQLAQEVSAKKSKVAKKDKAGDDLVFFNYTDKQEVKDKKPELPDADLIKKMMAEKLKKKSAEWKAVASGADESAGNQKGDKSVALDNSSEYSFYKAQKSFDAEFFDYSFELARIDGIGQLKKQNTYEFDFKDDYNDRVRSNSQGQIQLKGKTFGQNIRKFSVYALDIYPTVVDQQIVAGKEKVVIPVFSKSYFDKLLEGQMLRGLGGHIFVALDSLTEDVEIDVDIKYEKKLYFNDKFQVVEKADSDYDYILFVGIRPGNTIIKFKTYKNEITSKIVHVTNSEIFFDPNYYDEYKKDSFKLYEEHVLSKSIMPLNVDTQQITPFSQSDRPIKSAIGEYYFSKSLYPSSTRKYLELSHLKDSIFIGYSSNNEIVVPSENYIQVVMDKFGVRNMEQQCIIQLNIGQKAKTISFEGKSFRGAMRLTPLMLDKDGVFYDDFTAGTQRVFIHGEEQGIVNIKLEYSDDSVSYIQTYCSSNTYLVEQL